MTQPAQHATESEYGDTQYASNAEAGEGQRADRAMTPANHGSAEVNATTEKAGHAQQATTAEILAGARDVFVTPAAERAGADGENYIKVTTATGFRWVQRPPELGGQMPLNLHIDNSLTNAQATADNPLGVKAGGIHAAHLAAGAVETAKIHNAAVTLEKMAENSVGTAQYVDESIDLQALQTDVQDRLLPESGSQIDDSYLPVKPFALTGGPDLQTGDIATDAVETANIKDAAVTPPKLDAGNAAKQLAFRTALGAAAADHDHDVGGADELEPTATLPSPADSAEGAIVNLNGALQVNAGSGVDAHIFNFSVGTGTLDGGGVTGYNASSPTIGGTQETDGPARVLWSSQETADLYGRTASVRLPKSRVPSAPADIYGVIRVPHFAYGFIELERDTTRDTSTQWAYRTVTGDPSIDAQGLPANSVGTFEAYTDEARTTPLTILDATDRFIPYRQPPETADQIMATLRGDSVSEADADTAGLWTVADVDERIAEQTTAPAAFAYATNPTGRIPLAQSRIVKMTQAAYTTGVANGTIAAGQGIAYFIVG